MSANHNHANLHVKYGRNVREQRAQLHCALTNREPFTATNLSGTPYVFLTSPHAFGMMFECAPDEEVRHLQHYADARRILYVVRSFETPIAWLTDASPANPAQNVHGVIHTSPFWTITEAGYSQTTKRHKSIIGCGIDPTVQSWWAA